MTHQARLPGRGSDGPRTAANSGYGAPHMPTKERQRRATRAR